MKRQLERDERIAQAMRFGERIDRTIAVTHKKLGSDIYATARHYKLRASDIAYIVEPYGIDP